MSLNMVKHKTEKMNGQQLYSVFFCLTLYWTCLWKRKIDTYKYNENDKALVIFSDPQVLMFEQEHYLYS